MRNSRLNKLLKDNTEYKGFLSEQLNITEDFEIVKNGLPYYISSMAYSIGYKKIWLSNEIKRIIYFIAEKDELEELKEGCRFIIQHELGHSHRVEEKNKNVTGYFNRLLYINSGNYIMECFPESEATRYAISRSKDYVEALAGLSAISSFLYKSGTENSINSFSEHFSNSNVEEGKREILNAISSFRLSNENYAKILKKAETYLKKLNENLENSFLYKVKEKTKS
ncbi:MAG: hypothetical protein ACP5MV_00100 [Candidatus Parvarchaeum sp.]